MKKIFASIAFFSVFCLIASPYKAQGNSIIQKTEIEGIYKEKNLYFYVPSCKNPSENNEISAKVNGRDVLKTKAEKAFDIDLSKSGFEYGDNLKIELFYFGCKPFMVNENALEKRNSFKITDLTVNKSGELSFKTYNEIDKFPFIVQQYKWNKWVNVAKLDGNGGENWKEYSTNTHIVSGTNKFRVIRYNLWSPPTKSEEFLFESSKSKPSITYDKKLDQITFSSETSFKVLNQYGEVVEEGFGAEIITTNIPKGNYIIAYDNTYYEIKL